jgi:hypothetical protein
VAACDAGAGGRGEGPLEVRQHLLQAAGLNLLVWSVQKSSEGMCGSNRISLCVWVVCKLHGGIALIS